MNTENNRLNEWYVPKFGPRGFRIFVGMLFLPYTGMCISFAVLGSMLAVHTVWDRVVAISAIYGLGLGLAAHAADNLGSKNTKPWGNYFSNRQLWYMVLLGARTRTGIVNLNVAVREWNEQVIFLRKIVPGRADQSYGIQVARLAGLPPVVLSRAKDILNNLEKAELNAEGTPSLAAERDGGVSFARTRRKKEAIREGLGQMDLL